MLGYPRPLNFILICSEALSRPQSSRMFYRKIPLEQVAIGGRERSHSHPHTPPHIAGAKLTGRGWQVLPDSPGATGDPHAQAFSTAATKSVRPYTLILS